MYLTTEPESEANAVLYPHVSPTGEEGGIGPTFVQAMREEDCDGYHVVHIRPFLVTVYAEGTRFMCATRHHEHPYIPLANLVNGWTDYVMDVLSLNCIGVRTVSSGDRLYCVEVHVSPCGKDDPCDCDRCCLARGPLRNHFAINWRCDVKIGRHCGECDLLATDALPIEGLDDNTHAFFRKRLPYTSAQDEAYRQEDDAER